MPKIETVVIFGAGALGAFYASRFMTGTEFDVAVAASGPRGETLKNAGLVVNGQSFPIRVIDPTRPQPPADLLIVALKDHQLAAALPELRHLIGTQTRVLSVMNGLDSEEKITAACRVQPVLYGVVVGIDAVRQDGNVVVDHAGRLIFGEANNARASQAVREVQAALDQAGLAWETPVDMLRMVWWKFMVNVGVNQASAVLRAPYGVFQRSADAQDVVTTLMREVIAVAQAAGVALNEADLAAWPPVLETLSPVGKTSMLQDIEAGRKTEVEIFAGKVVALGERYGVPTPANRQMLSLIRVLEKPLS